MAFVEPELKLDTEMDMFEMSKGHSDLAGAKEDNNVLFVDVIDEAMVSPLPAEPKTVHDEEPTPLWTTGRKSQRLLWMVCVAITVIVLAVAVVTVVLLTNSGSAAGDNSGDAGDDGGDGGGAGDSNSTTQPTTQIVAERWRLRLLREYSTVGEAGSNQRALFINNFTSEMSTLLSLPLRDSSAVPRRWVQVFGVTAGSVVVDFRVSSEDGSTLQEDLQHFTDSLKAGSGALISGAPVASLERFVVVADKVWSEDAEFAYMLQGEVGTEGHMDSDPNWQAYGTDREEDRSSKSAVSDDFRFDFDLGYNVYQLTFNIPVNNNLDYQYAYTTVRYRTLMSSTSIDLSSKSHISFWMRCLGCPAELDVVVILQPARAKAVAGPVTSSWTNFRVPFSSSELSSVDHMAFAIEQAGSGVLELALITASDNATSSTRMPKVTGDLQTELDLADCSYFYEHFAENHIEWSYFNIDAKVPNPDRPRLFETDGTGTVTEESLSAIIPDQRQVGFFSYTVSYSLDAGEGYGYTMFNYMAAGLDSAVTTDASSFGTHLCLWLKAAGQSSLQVQLFSDSQSASRWTVRISDSGWHHHCLALAELDKMKSSPVDLSQLLHVVVADVTSPEVADELRTLGVALISFANSSTTYSVFPATMDPYVAVLTDSDGNCVDLVGPAPMAAADVPGPVVPAERYAIPSDYSYSGSARSRLAVYIDQLDSKWLDLAHSLKSIGIPFFLTTELSVALDYSTVLVYPYAPLGGSSASALAAHVNIGNTVIFGQIVSSDYESVCGVGSAGEASREMSYISFNSNASNLTADWTEEEEQHIKIWKDWPDVGWPVRTYSVVNGDGTTVLANYKKRTALGDDELQDDVAVFSKRNDAGGVCFSLGMDLGQLASASHKNKMAGTGRAFSSVYDPAQDMLFRLIRNVYFEQSEGVTLAPIMDGKKVAIMITHDCDANRPDLWEEWARREHAKGVKSTFMIYTKLNRDGQAALRGAWCSDYHRVQVYDVPFYLRSFDAFAAVTKYGHELGSHSTAHSPNFGPPPQSRFDFPIGNGTEQFDYMAGYSPKITCQQGNLSMTYEECKANSEYKAGALCNYGHEIGSSEKICGFYQTEGGTIVGDLRVSKFLVDRIYSRAGLDNQCVSFRPGHLKYPPQMDEALEATGYKYVSVNEANEVATHLYYQKTYQGANNNPSANQEAELDVFEFPILFDDLSDMPLRGGWEEPSAALPRGSMLYHSVQVTQKISKFGGIVVVLSHPTDEYEGYSGVDKIEWQEGLIDRTTNYSTTVTFSEMGDFARGRNAVEIDITPDGGLRTVHIRMNSAMPVKGLTLEIPVTWYLTSTHAVPMDLRPSDTPEHKIVVIEQLTEDVDILFVIS